jgi:hypothetical protein
LFNLSLGFGHGFGTFSTSRAASQDVMIWPALQPVVPAAGQAVKSALVINEQRVSHKSLNYPFTALAWAPNFLGARFNTPTM